MSQITIEKAQSPQITPEIYQTVLDMIAKEEHDEMFDEDFYRQYNEDIENLITEDDTPVDNIFSAKQQRLLTQTLYASWKPTLNNAPRLFFAEANIGLYIGIKEAAIVPDVLVSLDVTAPENPLLKEQRAYLAWRFGKIPEIVIEIVSNKKGDEFDEKLRRYERMNISYYIVFDPAKHLKRDILTVFAKNPDNGYMQRESSIFKHFDLGLTLWEGEFEGLEALWIRWTDGNGNLLPMPIEEKADLINRAENAEEKARKLADKLRELGVNPEEI